MEAQEWCRKYVKSGNVKDLTQAWDLYYHVFRRISKQLPQVRVESRSTVSFSCDKPGTWWWWSKTPILKPCFVLPPCWQLTSLELQYVSPKLLMCRDLELAVPGTYDPNQPIIRIQSIAPSLQVITSKQRPRKLTLMGEKVLFCFIYLSKWPSSGSQKTHSQRGLGANSFLTPDLLFPYRKQRARICVPSEGS